jgi:Putative Ig domain
LITSSAARWTGGAITKVASCLALAIVILAGVGHATTLRPPATSSTTWSVASDHKTILLSIDHSRAAPFVIKGVDYSPRPINDSALAGPGTDYFWGDPSHLTYELIWTRDVWGSTYNDAQLELPDGALRQLGANSIRTYAWWKWVPRTPSDYVKWKTLDWSVGPRVRFGDTTTPPGFAAYPAHDGGDQFLDLCWNNGVNPIYVVIGISVDPWTGFASTNPNSAQWHDEQMYLAKTTQWLARRYGYHPAVLGFAIGNETNLPFDRGTDRFIEYWNYLNHLGAIVKHYAPGKLTMSAFEDYPTGQTPMLLRRLVAFKDLATARQGAATAPVCVDMNGARPSIDCTSPHRRAAYPADVYALDVWGFNSYRKPESEDVANFKHWVIDGNYTSGSHHDNVAPNRAPKPVILTEWGAPASIRTRAGAAPTPPNPDWVTVSRGVPGKFHGASGYRAAALIQQIANDIYGPHSTLSTAGGGILSGGYIFELQDEWWKEDQRDPATWSSHDTTVQKTTFSFGEPGNGFAGYWDEEWFGLMSTKAGSTRSQRCEPEADARSGACHGLIVGSGIGAPDDPVLTAAGTNGWLNGGADEVTPRAGFYGLQSVFKGTHASDDSPDTKPPIVAARVTCPASPQVFCQVHATNTPTSFELSGLPAGLQFDSRQGIIFGSYDQAKDFSVRVTAINDRGRSRETVVMINRGRPIESASAADRPKLTTVSFKPNRHP